MKFSAKRLKKIVEDKRRAEREAARRRHAQLELRRARQEEAARAVEAEKRQVKRILRTSKIVILEQALQGHMAADISDATVPALDALEARGFRCQTIVRSDPKVRSLRRAALRRMSSAYDRIREITESHLKEGDPGFEVFEDEEITGLQDQNFKRYLATHFWQVDELKEHLDRPYWHVRKREIRPELNEYKDYSDFFSELFGHEKLIASIFAPRKKGTPRKKGNRRNAFLRKVARILKKVGDFSIEGPDDVEVDVVTWSGRNATRTIGKDFMHASCMRWLASDASSRFRTTIFDRLESLASEGKQTFELTCQDFNDRAKILGTPKKVLPIPFGVAPLCDLFKCLGYETSVVTNKARPSTLIVRVKW